ncbi:MAG: hypothetical protein RQ732_11355, partial [Methylophaga sp.]|nr:hypothetical protein [Methylophaga sp.]
EWNLEKFPVADRHTMPSWLAAIASLQGWDGLMLYGYSQSALNSLVNGSNYSSYNDPSLMAMMPAAALLYRQQHVDIARQHYRLQLPAEVFFGEAINADNSATIRTLLEQSRLTIDVQHLNKLPWLSGQAPALANVAKVAENPPLIITDANKDYIAADQQFVAADTGQIKRNWQTGILTIDSPQSQIMSGNIGQESYQLSSSEFHIETQSAVVAIQSLNEKPISDALEILISKIGHSLPVSRPSSAFVVEPIIGDILIKAPAGLKLYSLNSNGKRQQLDVGYQNGAYHIRLDASQQSPWLLLH